MIDARNYIAAHNDRINLNSLLSDEARQEDPEKIQIEISWVNTVHGFPGFRPCGLRLVFG
jgi:hypothetical protein